MKKTFTEISGNAAILLGQSPKEISVGNIIYNYSWGNMLITEKNEKKLKLVYWFKDSLPSKIGENTYEIFETCKGQTLLSYVKYHRPNINTKHHDDLVKKLEEAGIK
mgnify:CR=1 FL=1